MKLNGKEYKILEPSYDDYNGDRMMAELIADFDVDLGSSANDCRIGRLLPLNRHHLPFSLCMVCKQEMMFV